MSDVMAQLAKGNGMTPEDYSMEVVLSAVKVLSLSMEKDGIERDSYKFTDGNETIILSIRKFTYSEIEK